MFLGKKKKRKDNKIDGFVDTLSNDFFGYLMERKIIKKYFVSIIYFLNGFFLSSIYIFIFIYIYIFLSFGFNGKLLAYQCTYFFLFIILFLLLKIISNFIYLLKNYNKNNYIIFICKFFLKFVFFFKIFIIIFFKYIIISFIFLKICIFKLFCFIYFYIYQFLYFILNFILLIYYIIIWNCIYILLNNIYRSFKDHIFFFKFDIIWNIFIVFFGKEKMKNNIFLKIFLFVKNVIILNYFIKLLILLDFFFHLLFFFNKTRFFQDRFIFYSWEEIRDEEDYEYDNWKVKYVWIKYHADRNYFGLSSYLLWKIHIWKYKFFIPFTYWIHRLEWEWELLEYKTFTQFEYTVFELTWINIYEYIHFYFLTDDTDIHRENLFLDFCDYIYFFIWEDLFLYYIQIIFDTAGKM